jgi:hypothetical protein
MSATAISRILRLASPFMRGEDVRVAQRALTRAGHPCGTIDGVFGPATANASKEAKWAIGYAPKQCTPVYGAALHNFLTGATRPGAAMRTRSAVRRRQAEQAAAARSIGSRAAGEMVRWYEQRWREEPARSNRVPQLQALCRQLGLSAYYASMGFPWCALATNVAALVHGSKTADEGLRKGKFNALYTPSIRSAAEAGQHGMRAVARERIQHGTGLLMDFGGANGTEVDHIGFALGRVGDPVTAGGRTWTPGAGRVVTVEGNTAYDSLSGSQANGGCVAIRVRSVAVVRTAFEIS